MPSPIGHALAGFAAGWLAAPDACRVSPSVAQPRLLAWPARWRWPLTFAAAGMAADLDLLAGLHSRYTHSAGAVALVFAGAWLMLARRHRRPAAMALAVSLSYASHLLLDWLGSDTAPPLGIMALWPFTHSFYQSPVSVFMGISRRYWLAAAWMQNGVSVARELLVLLPVAGLAFWVRRPRSR